MVWEQTGKHVQFSRASNGESSSALEFAEHLQAHPEVTVVERLPMKTTALKDLDIWASNGKLQTFLNLDIQGAELSALRGMGRNISTCLAIYTEVNLRELYKGCLCWKKWTRFFPRKGLCGLTGKFSLN